MLFLDLLRTFFWRRPVLSGIMIALLIILGVLGHFMTIPPIPCLIVMAIVLIAVNIKDYRHSRQLYETRVRKTADGR